MNIEELNKKIIKLELEVGVLENSKIVNGDKLLKIKKEELEKLKYDKKYIEVCSVLSSKYSVITDYSYLHKAVNIDKVCYKKKLKFILPYYAFYQMRWNDYYKKYELVNEKLGVSWKAKNIKYFTYDVCEFKKDLWENIVKCNGRRIYKYSDAEKEYKKNGFLKNEPYRIDFVSEIYGDLTENEYSVLEEAMKFVQGTIRNLFFVTQAYWNDGPQFLKTGEFIYCIYDKKDSWDWDLSKAIHPNYILYRILTIKEPRVFNPVIKDIVQEEVKEEDKVEVEELNKFELLDI